jgi:hypothetical protein
MRAVRDDPQGTGLERIRRELVAALSAITSVRNIDSFGSVATGCADQWSDLDLLISCEVPEHTAWLAAGAIRSTKRVAFYRMFTGVAQPSGRYWFCNESPFHRLDVTFHSPAEHAAVPSDLILGLASSMLTRQIGTVLDWTFWSQSVRRWTLMSWTGLHANLSGASGSSN